MFVLPVALQRPGRYHMLQGRNCSASRGFPDILFLFPLIRVVLFFIQWVLYRSLEAPKMGYMFPSPRSLVLVLSWQPDTTGISK